MTTFRERWRRIESSLSGKTLWTWLKKTRLVKTLVNYIWWDDVIALLLLGLGIFYYWAGIPENPSLKWQQIYQDMYSDMIGIGITVLILGNFDQYLRIQSEKKRLILQMGSPNQGFAIEAVRQLTQNSWLVDGTTKGAYLLCANLERAYLYSAHLEQAYLYGANLEKTNLEYAHLEGANLEYAHLEKSNLEYAHLEGANLYAAHLEGANLGYANLEKTNLEYANLDKANLEGADLGYANLRGADLFDARLARTNLFGATYNNQTKWPAGFNPEKENVVLIEPNDIPDYLESDDL